MHESLAHACLQHFLFFFGQLPDFRPQTAPSTPATCRGMKLCKWIQALRRMMIAALVQSKKLYA
jgi:hypothetical protein